MTRLTKHDTQELPAVPAPAYTPEQIQQGLETWHRNLKTAQAENNILGIQTAHRYLNAWLDRFNAPKL